MAGRSNDGAPARAASGPRPPSAAATANAPSIPGPAFAKDFPRDPELDRVLALFEQGNYAAVRTAAADLIARTKDDEIRAAAKQILDRLKPDPLALYLVGIAAALLVILAGWYWTHPHEALPPPSNQGIQPPAPGPVSS